MAKVLYIIAHPGKEEKSFSLSVGRAFLEGYKKLHPQDTITEYNLYKDGIPLIDGAVLSGWTALQLGKGFDSLTPDEAGKIGQLSKICDQFVESDKYIFISPMWNFGAPPLLKAYIDAIVVAGKTFNFTEAGPVGLLKNKKGIHIQASGGFYSEGPLSGLDHSTTHLKSVLGFLGVADMQTLYVEGTAQFPDKADEFKQKAVAIAQELVKTF